MVVKKGKFIVTDESKPRLIIQNWSVTLTAAIKMKKTSALTIWPPINVLFSKQDFKGINKVF